MAKTITKLVNNIFLEINFILFPIWILPSYFLLKSIFNSPEIPFLIFLILLGESHFASTFLFFFDKSNKSFIKSNSLLLIYIPIILLIAFFLFGLRNFQYATLLVAIASGIHVTRQSIGIAKIYGQSKNTNIEFLIYLSSGFFLFIGFLRMYAKDINLFNNFTTIFLQNPINFLFGISENNLFKVCLLVLFSLFSLSEKTNYKKKLTNLTGVLIYSPYLFVNNVYDAIVIGVGAHWAQYLLINYKIYFYRESINKKNILKLSSIIFYAFLMGILGYKYFFTTDITKVIILIPLCGQMFHFYIDAFIWRFSNPLIRKSIGSRLFAE